MKKLIACGIIRRESRLVYWHSPRSRWSTAISKLHTLHSPALKSFYLSSVACAQFITPTKESAEWKKKKQTNTTKRAKAIWHAFCYCVVVCAYCFCFDFGLCSTLSLFLSFAHSQFTATMPCVRIERRKHLNRNECSSSLNSHFNSFHIFKQRKVPPYIIYYFFFNFATKMREADVTL